MSSAETTKIDLSLLQEKNPQNKPILLFDSVCNLCNGAIQFAIERDKKSNFMFASLQSEIGQALLEKFKLPTKDFDSFILIEGENYYKRSTAALRVAKGFGGLWNLIYWLIIFPAPIRDAVYSFVAKNRYKWFGKQESCWMPTPELRARFLD